MSRARLVACIPFVVCLVIAAALWALTGQISYAERAGQIGPTVWPRFAIGVMAVAALLEIARKLLSPAPEQVISGIGEVLEGAHEEEDAPRRPALLLAGIALTAGFAMVVSTLGFLLTTFVYLVAFMYVGRYRNHLVIWLSSLLGTLVFAAIFLKLVYVSLPRGTPPFDAVTQFILDLLGRF